jgi:uncharacterized Fe-S radical SAM superfamily protein PflX
MITFAAANENTLDVVNEKLRKMVETSHKDMIIRLEFVPKERKTISVSREGMVCLWTVIKSNIVRARSNYIAVLIRKNSIPDNLGCRMQNISLNIIGLS